MTDNTIMFKNIRYYYYDEYKNFKTAINTAKYWKKRKKGNRYYIQKVDKPGIFGGIKYQLYMTKIISLT